MIKKNHISSLSNKALKEITYEMMIRVLERNVKGFLFYVSFFYFLLFFTLHYNVIILYYYRFTLYYIVIAICYY